MTEADIRRIVQEEIQRSASDSRFGLKQIPNHAHTGVDGSPQISQSNVIQNASISGSITFAQQTTYALNLNGTFTPSNVWAYGVITGNGTPTTKTLSGTTPFLLAGAKTATMTSVWAGSTAIQSTTFGNPNGDIRQVTFTSGSANISWSVGLTQDVTSSTITTIVGGEKYMTIGSANLGTSFYFQPLSNTSVQTGNIQYPFIDPNINQIVPMQNAVYFGTDGINNHALVGDGGHIIDVAIPAIKARATVTSFSKDVVNIDVVTLAAGYQILVNWIVT